MARRNPVRGFKNLAVEICSQTPGLNADQVAERALKMAKERGTPISNAMFPRTSLGNTLRKYWKQWGLERLKQGTSYVYFFPNTSGKMVEVGSTPLPQKSNEYCCTLLTAEDAKRVKALMDLGLYEDQHEAHRQLIRVGLDSHISRLAKGS